MNQQIQAIEQVISSCLPVFLIMFIGWYSVKAGFIDKSAKGVFSNLVSNYVFPALLFVQVANAKPAQVFNGKWMLAFAVAMVIVWLVSFISNKVFLGCNLKQSSMQAMLCSFPNMGGMGVPFLTLLLGAGSTISIAIANFVVALTLIPVTIFLLELSDCLVSGDKVKASMVIDAIKKSLMKPMFLAVILGVICSITDATHHLPGFVFNAAKIMSDSCNFISLMAVGVAVYGISIKINKALITNVIIKSFITPVLTWIVIMVFHIQGMEAEELMFLLAMPTASTATILAYQWKVQENEASSIYIASTLLSIIILPTLMVLMENYMLGVK